MRSRKANLEEQLPFHYDIAGDLLLPNKDFNSDI
jgi:hypothetical protein